MEETHILPVADVRNNRWHIESSARWYNISLILFRVSKTQMPYLFSELYILANTTEVYQLYLYYYCNISYYNNDNNGDITINIVLKLIILKI